jgi:hypothetical protein
MDFTPTALERAFALAKSGEYAGVADLRKQLRTEGYSDQQINGPALLRQLRDLCAASRITQPDSPAE